MLVQKGGEIERFSSTVAAAWGPLVGGYAGFGHGGALGLDVALGAFRLGPRASFSLGGEDDGANRVTTTTLGIGLRLSRRWWEDAPIELVTGVGAFGEATWQTLRRLDADVTGAAGYPVERSFRAFGLGAELFVRAERPLGDRSVLGLELGGALVGANAGSLRAFPRVQGSAYFGLRF